MRRQKKPAAKVEREREKRERKREGEGREREKRPRSRRKRERKKEILKTNACAHLCGRKLTLSLSLRRMTSSFASSRRPTAPPPLVKDCLTYLLEHKALPFSLSHTHSLPTLLNTKHSLSLSPPPLPLTHAHSLPHTQTHIRLT